jgi:hypothetical protein
MKKLVAGVATAAALSLTIAGTAGTAEAAGYQGKTPQVIKKINKAVNPKGKINAKKANQLKRQVKAAKKAGLITPKQAAKLIKKINKDTKKKK